jgi:predicted dehydrogenase
MAMTPYRTALIGLGKMGLGNAADPKLAQFYKYSSHAQVIDAHPAFELGAVYDRDQQDEGAAFQSLEEINEKYRPQVLVLATPPQERLDMIKKFASLQTIIMEKPVATDSKTAQAIDEYCAEHSIAVQVNYWRRFDFEIVKLRGQIADVIGDPQVIFMTYGHGLRNNAVHLIDQIRYLFGEISAVRGCSDGGAAGPIGGDVNVDFEMTLCNRAKVFAKALDFDHYRGVGLDIWGTRGRVEFLQGGLVMRCSRLNDHRALDGVTEMTSDQAVTQKTGASEALYGLYDNVAQMMEGEGQLLSPLSSAVVNEQILDSILS